MAKHGVSERFAGCVMGQHGLTRAQVRRAGRGRSRTDRRHRCDGFSVRALRLPSDYGDAPVRWLDGQRKARQADLAM